ncbi:MAG TPA: efflux RND transporter periplasmic adaptor subunit [Vicinamibacterales bacterium]|jgi:HlyD family secretion protein|nr:efflux RND transporter periplasmic adaptor subunit [Vicinamibacterales bacterium]
MKRAITVLLLVAAIGAGAGAYYYKRGGNDIQVNTAPITRGDILDTVGATGTLQAVTTVQVGSQVSGTISWLGADFNSIVKKDQVIARLEPSLFEAQVAQAKANLIKSQADLERTKVELTDAQQKYTRAKELAARSLLPQSDLDAAKIAVDSAQAALQSAQATVEQAQATLNQNQVNLDHSIIQAPIDGIVTQRSVDVGQTVAASMQAPTLFIIAADLTKMQVNANIDEADVGRIRPQQHVTFRVDAYPTETFEGTVAQIRLQPVVVQNVTTYGTVIDVPNGELKLKPGMTANVKIEIAKKTDILRVANAALRFRPTPDIFAALNQAVPPEVQFAGRGRGRGQGSQGSAGSQGSQGSAAAGQPPQGSTTPKGPTTPTQAQAPGDPADRQARMLERFKTMSPDEQKQFIARLKDRGADTSPFEKAAPAKPDKPAKTGLPKVGVQSAQTIDALFAPLPPVESRGRAWLYADHLLKPVSLRLGITDGTNTEILGEELQTTMEVVTSVTGVGAIRTTQGGAGNGNPLLPGGRGPGGFGGAGGRGGR